MKKPTPATDRVESFLRAQKKDLEENNIDHSKVAVIDRLLSFGDMEDAWANLLESCPPGYPSSNHTWERWQFVVDMLVDIAIASTPEKIKDIRDALREIATLNLDIAIKSAALAQDMRKRDRVISRSHGYIAGPENQTPFDLLHRATELSENDHTGGLFERYIAPLLRGFDLKYWPTTADMLDALAEAQMHYLAEAQLHDEPIVRDTILAAVLEVRQASLRDSMRALDEALEGFSDNGYVGARIELSGEAYACFCKALLGLDEIDVEAVNRYRYNERQRKENRQP